MGAYVEHSINKNLKTNKEIIEKILDNTLSYRKKADISYRPYQVDEYVDMSNNPGVDFGKVYPDYIKGDYAYISTYLDGLHEREILINIRGCTEAQVYFNGEEQILSPGPNNTLDVYVTFKEGENRLIVKAVAQKGSFSVYAFPLVPKLRYGTGGDYAYCTWQYIKKDGYRLQEMLEFSRLYKKDEKEPKIDEIEWVYPVLPPQSNIKTFDFSKLCKNGYSAYAYTCVKGKINIEHKNPLKIFSDNKVIYTSEHGIFKGDFENTTPLLIKSTRQGENWEFKATTEGEHSLPFVDGADCPDLQWIWIGPFGRKGENIDYPYGPEAELGFIRPYATACGGNAYWNFYRKNTYLRQYLHSAFYGKWFYAIMVGLYGMKQAAQKLGKKGFDQYFLESIRLLCLHRDYGESDNKRSGYASYLATGGRISSLDAIGTIGTNVSEYYMMSNDSNAQNLLNILGNVLTYKIPRFSDGTFYRIKTMWTDDMYMCLPFMVRLGAISGDKSYFDDILTQVRGFYKRLYMEDKELFSHIFFVEEGKANRVPWGRGNGWVLLALSEVLLLMPKDYHGREEILRVFQKFAGGVLKYRNKEKGIWHQVIDNPDSYIETSGSAMFITALARGVINGWISPKYKEDISCAWEALCSNCIDEKGNIYGICMGSGCNMEEKYYMQLDTIENDDHGIGVVLSAGVEVMNMLNEN